MKKKSLAVNAILNGLRNILNLIFPLITFPYVTRILSVEGIGEYNFANSVVVYFLLISGLGISTYAIREGAKYRDDIEAESKFVSEILSLNIVSTIMSYVLLILVMMYFSQISKYSLVITIFSLQIFFTTIGVEWLFSIYEEYAYITIRSIVFKVISIILLFVFVKNKDDVAIYALITVFSSVGSNVLNFIRAQKMVRIRITFKFNWKKHVKPILILFASTVAIQIYAYSGVTILGFMKDTYIVGIYSVSSKVYNIIKNGLAAVLIVTIPRLSMLWGKGRFEEYKSLFKEILNVLLLLVLPIMTGLFVMSRQVVMLLSGKAYLQATSSLQILCLALLFSIIAWLFNDCVLIPAKRESNTLYSTVTSAVINIILSLALIPQMGQNGVALAILGAEVCGMVMNLYFARDIIKINLIVSDYVGAIFGCGVIAMECILVSHFIQSSVISLFTSVSVSVFTYGMILILTRNSYTLQIFNRFRSKITRWGGLK